MRSAYTAIVAVCGISACSLPPFEYEGDHVVVASNYRVCSGTLESFDRAVEHIDAQLGLDPADEPLRIAILDDAESDQLHLCETCRTYWNGVLVVLAPHHVEEHATHEMAHARELANGRESSVPLFSEGIAVAVAPTLCPPHGPPPSLEELLMVQDPWAFDRDSYYAGGELVAWLLETHGAVRVLDFLRNLRRPEAASRASDPEFVRASYRAHFGTELDDDIFAHIRSPDQLTPEQLGCLAPPAPVQSDRIQLQATLDCDSPRVQTDFRYANRGFVDWTLDLSKVPAPRRYRLLTEIPKQTDLKIVRCMCDLNVAGERSTWSGESEIGANIELEPGAYVVRWQGPLDRGLELDVEIEAYDIE